MACATLPDTWLHDFTAPNPEDIQKIIKSMWDCQAPNQGIRGGSPCEISAGEASSIIDALTTPVASANPKPSKRSKTSAMKVSSFLQAHADLKQCLGPMILQMTDQITGKVGLL